jgi:hypothetical protein
VPISDIAVALEAELSLAAQTISLKFRGGQLAAAYFSGSA